MNWIAFTEEKQMNEIKEQSKQQTVVIFKYSSRCSISDVVQHRLEKAEPPANTLFYFLDVIRYRSMSKQVAEDYNVHHESPQILVIKNGECIYDDSHAGITMTAIREQAETH